MAEAAVIPPAIVRNPILPLAARRLDGYTIRASAVGV